MAPNDQAPQTDVTAQDMEKLSMVNQKLGAFPIIYTYDALISQKEAGGEGAQDLDQKLAQVADEIKDAVPVLVKLGMFDLFSVDEWCAGNRPGRNLVGKFTKELGGP